MEQARKTLFKNLKKIKKASTKEDAYKINMALKMVITKHTKDAPQDTILLRLFSGMDGIAFCNHILSLLEVNPLVEFQASAEKEEKKKKTNNKRKGILEKLREEFKPCKISLSDMEPLPTEREIAVHYRGLIHQLEEGGLSSVENLLEALKNLEPEPLLIPLWERLRTLFHKDLLVFLPFPEILRFFKQWDGEERSLIQWKLENRYEPLLRVLRDAGKHPQEKKNMIAPMLSRLSETSRCGKFSKMDIHHIQEIFSFIEKMPGLNLSFAREVAAMDLGRRTKCVDRRGNVLPYSLGRKNHFHYLYFWDLGPRFARRDLISLDPSTAPVSETTFALSFFGEGSVQDGCVFRWRGVDPYRVEYVDIDGQKIVQTPDLYRQICGMIQQKNIPFVPLNLIVPEDKFRLEDLTKKWIRGALGSFLDAHFFDLDLMAVKIMSPLSGAKTFSEWALSLYQFIGRLHPVFPLSRYHGVLRERIQHLYFRLENIIQTPVPFLFPELNAATNHREEMAAMWKSHQKIFAQKLWSQWTMKNHAAFDPIYTELYFTVPLMDRNDHFTQEGVRESLETHSEALGPFLLDEDIIPYGKSMIGSLVECPDYYSETSQKRVITTEDFLRFLDEYAFIPARKYKPILEETDSMSGLSDDDDDDEEIKDECDLDEENLDN